MTCDEARALIDPYIDGELEPAVVQLLTAHADGCSACTHQITEARALSRAIRKDLPALAAPDALRSRVVDAIRTPALARPREFSAPRFSRRPWLAAAALYVVVGGAGWLLGVGHGRSVAHDAGQPGLRDAVVASHLRSLQASHLVDVPSSDRHTVKPWFDGKLDFSPPVTDLAAQGFPLLGGRLDYLDGHPVAALVYGRAKHVVNLFVWPTSAAESRDAPPTTVRGYHVQHWVRDGMTFWAVSDVAEPDLQMFASLVQGTGQPAESVR
jgi:anti-sigma factor RsiW